MGNSRQPYGGFSFSVQRQNSTRPFDNNNNQPNSPEFKYDAIYENQQRQLAASSNLNPFGSSGDFSTTANALVALQGIQMVASKSNVMLFAVGGIVSRFILKSRSIQFSFTL